MVITREVPRESWRRVLDDLSRLHAGAPAHLVVLDDEHGPQTHGDAFALVGMSSDGDAGAESIVAILACGDAHVTHIIGRPRSLHVELLWESRTANIQITETNGTRTVICLGPPVFPATTSKPTTTPVGRPADGHVDGTSRALVTTRAGA
jgi:hypothetical protein